MASPDQIKPKSQSLLGGLFRNPSLLILIICGFLYFGTRIYAHYSTEGVLYSSKPVPALRQWFADLQGYHARFASYPPSLRELEKEIWMPARKSAGKSTETQLQHGPRIYIYGDYAYIYQRDANDASICSVWAVPQGEHYKEAYTYYELITPKSITEWRGGALTPEQMRAIPASARPTGEEMAKLGMFRQREVTDTKPKKKGGLLSIFN